MTPWIHYLIAFLVFCHGFVYLRIGPTLPGPITGWKRTSKLLGAAVTGDSLIALVRTLHVVAGIAILACAVAIAFAPEWWRAPAIIGGIIGVEAVTNYQGLATVILNAVTNKDLPVLQYSVMVIAAIYMVATLLADVIIGKKWSRRRKKCHDWAAGWRLLENSHDDRTTAFAHGFITHLAADTVAHNHFIPEQIVRTEGAVDERAQLLSSALLGKGHLASFVYGQVQKEPGLLGVLNLLHHKWRKTHGRFIQQQGQRGQPASQDAGHRLQRLDDDRRPVPSGHAIVVAHVAPPSVSDEYRDEGGREGPFIAEIRRLAGRELRCGTADDAAVGEQLRDGLMPPAKEAAPDAARSRGKRAVRIR